MKAYALHNISDLRFEDVKKPIAKVDEVLVKVKACGICSSDIPRIFKTGTYHFPTIPGHEFSGIVESVGDERNKSLIGKRVSVFPLLPCNNCEQCKKKNYEMCKSYGYLGSRNDGGFAEYVAVPVWNLIELPDNVSYEAGAMMEPLSVAMHSISQIKGFENQSILIIGTGMIAFAISLFATYFGCKKVTMLSRDFRKKFIADKIKNLIMVDKIDNEKFTSVFEVVGSNDTLVDAINYSEKKGTVVLVGNPASDMTLNKNVYWSILRSQLTIKGVWNSKYDGKNESDWTKVLNILSSKNFNSEIFITHKFNSSELKAALKMMYEHTETYCKVMLIWEDKEESNG